MKNTVDRPRRTERVFERVLALSCCVGVLLVLTLPVEAALTAEVRLPSEAADGGTLGLLVKWPQTPAQDRFRDGPPIVVRMQGTNTAGPDPIGLGYFADGAGVVVVQFVYPGWQGVISSDGVYDYRGPNCILAARDVWLFALGLTTDELDRTIHDVVGRPVLTTLMGVEAYSGGNRTTPAVLSTYPDDLVGRVRYVDFNESPGSTQIWTNELGRLNRDCNSSIDGDGNGIPYDDGKNPRYDPMSDYGYDEVQLDYSSLAWDTSLQQSFADGSGEYPTALRNGILFFDGNGNGQYDSIGQQRCADVDLNGSIDLDEDWWISHPKAVFFGVNDFSAYYSTAVARYLEAHPEIFPSSIWPDWLASADDTEAFHQPRMANLHYHLLGPYAATLRTISSFDQVPHAHVTADHTQTRIEQDGLATSGIWRRLNPDASYVEAYLGSVPSGYPDSPANIDVPFGEMYLHASPDGVDGTDLGIPAIMELVDRTYYGGWPAQLDGILESSDPPEPLAENLHFSAPDTLDWNETANNLFYDVIRGDVLALELLGSSVTLGPLYCVEEDSQDLTATDTETPPVGSAWFYLVRPNGLQGNYGSDSSQSPRVADDTDCLH